MEMTSLPVSVFLMLCLCVPVTLSCVCQYQPPQDLMCSQSKQTTFVLKGKVKNPKTLPSGVTKYKLNVLRVFKGASELVSADQQWIYINKKLGTCPRAAFLSEEKKVYLIAGRVKMGGLWLGTCPFYYQWYKMTKKVKNGFRGNYLEHCDCKTSDCPNGLYRKHCYLNYSYCTLSNSTSMCEWQHTAAVDRCLHGTSYEEQ